MIFDHPYNAEYSRRTGRVLAGICLRRVSGSDVGLCVPSRIGLPRIHFRFGVGFGAGFGGAMNVAAGGVRLQGAGGSPGDGLPFRLLAVLLALSC